MVFIYEKSLYGSKVIVIELLYFRVFLKVVVCYLVFEVWIIKNVFEYENVVIKLVSGKFLNCYEVF